MYFKRIDICGFKSFAEPITIDLSKGITCIVGPNGSGKSNVSDAIRWVLGEQSPKILRGGKMEDVIFSGTAKRRSKGMAEVVLVIDNSKGILPVDYSEVAITRRAFRSGEGEYYINGNQCRLRDIRELIMDTGIGVDGYSLIGQGKIADIVSNKAESRREIFEEAAGIVKYRSKKLEAEKKLEATGLNLSRVNDILSEISQRIEPLKEESRIAKEFLELSDEYKKVEVNLILKNIEDFDLKNEYLKDDLVELQFNLEEIVQKQEELKSEISKANKELTGLDALLQEARDKNLCLTEEIGNIKSDDRIRTERLGFFEKEEERLRFEFEENLNKLEFQKNYIKSVESEIVSIDKELLEKKEEFAEKEKEYKEKLSFTEDLEKRVEEKKADLFTAHAELAGKKAENSSLDSMITSLATKKNALFKQEEEEKKKEQLEILQKEKLEQNYENERRRKQELISLVEKEKIAYSEISRSLRFAAKELENKKYDFAKISSRNKTLQELQNNYDGYNYAVKYVMKTGFEGVHGVLADLLSVPAGYELAIETALANSLQNIVCTTDDVARRIIEILKKEKIGRITFLPISSIKPSSAALQKEIEECEGFCGLARNCIDFDDKYGAIVDYLLGRVIVADNLKNALAISKKIKSGFRVVTLEGDVINTAGAITGGAYKNKTANILERKAEIAESLQKIGFLELELEKLQKESESLSVLQNEKRKILDELDKKSKDVDTAYMQAENQLNLFEGKSKELRLAAEKRQNEINAIVEEERKTVELTQKLGDENRKRQESIENLKLDIEKGMMLLQSEKEPIRILQEDLTRIQVKMAEVQNLLNSKKDVFSEGKKQEEQYAQKSLNLKENLEKLDSERKLLLEGSADVSMLAEKEKEKEGLEKYINEISEKRIEIIDKTAKNTDASEDFATRRNTLADSKYELELKLAKNESQLEALKNKLWDEFEISYIQASSYKNGEINFQEAQKTAKQLKSRIRALGNVNIGAIKEYEEVSERYDFLGSQKADILEAMNSLKNIIDDMDKTIKSRFKESFDSIVDNFESTFNELFGGGNAMLSLENPENPLDSPIEIIAQPPGKKLQNINLLSGGEKTMTAIALMFAVLKTRPTPFCILDEVEAALDDGNVEKFANYLRKFEDIQFALITHQKVTMEYADVLYGITMPEQGVSKLLSLKLQNKAG